MISQGGEPSGFLPSIWFARTFLKRGERRGHAGESDQDGKWEQLSFEVRDQHNSQLHDALTSKGREKRTSRKNCWGNFAPVFMPDACVTAVKASLPICGVRGPGTSGYPSRFAGL